MKPLIAVVTCGKFRDRADVQRRTWLPDADAFDVKFFIGAGNTQEREDEILLDAPDDYVHLRQKVQLAFRWAVDNGYQAILKTDDDVYIIPSRLLGSFGGQDYRGRVRGPSYENDAPRIYGSREQSFCSGFGYILSARAASIVAGAPNNGDWAEDRFAGNALAVAGIRPLHDTGFLLWPPLSGHYCSVPNVACGACRAQYAFASVICPYAKPQVPEILHNFYKNGGFIPTWL